MGLRIIEIGSIGPGPFCAMMLADWGFGPEEIEQLESTRALLT